MIETTTAPYWQSRLLWEIERTKRPAAKRLRGFMADTPNYEHKPVLLQEVLESLITDPGGLYLDATLGLGGHSSAILEATKPSGRLLGLDWDPESVSRAGDRLKPYGARFKAVRSNFRSAPEALEREKFFPLAGALFDLGVSSLHFDKAERGFSFQKEGPLDMRLAPDNPLTADAIVNRWPEEQISMLLKEFGEEPQARRIAKSIVAAREKAPLRTTLELAAVVEKAVGRSGRTHPATRTFMALRIAVNAELENLTRGVEGVLPYLQQGGRLCVITFHSLEDRIVKTLFASFVEQGACRFVGKRAEAIAPSDAEVESNARARSAKLRVVEKL